MAKHHLREQAIALRRTGLSYSEILKQVPVAKSTLSLWLRSVGLAKEQKQRLTEKKMASALLGGQKRRLQRLATIDRINKQCVSEIGTITERELFLMGVMLYWAEGAKEKEYSPGSMVKFTNSDPGMIRLFIQWLHRSMHIDDERICPELYVHENRKADIQKMIDFWSESTGFPKEKFSRVYLKKDKTGTKRKNVGDLYFGILRVTVKASSELNRRLNGWARAASL